MVRPLVSVVVVFLSAVFASSLSVNVTRSDQDVISVSRSSWSCSYCSHFNQGICLSGSQQCQCPKTYSTFLMHNRTCVPASDLVKENKCLNRKDGKMDFLNVVDLTSSSSYLYQYPSTVINCTLRVQAFCYLKQEAWECTDLSGSQVFRVKRKDATTLSLHVSGSSDVEPYSGRIIRVELSCNASKDKNRCILLKTKGTLAGKFQEMPGSPEQEQSTAVVIEPDQEGTTSPIATSSITSTPTTTITTTSHTSPVNRSNQVDVTKINGAVSVDDDEDQDEVVVATISVAGAIICVLIICVFTWLIIRHRYRSGRHDEANTPNGIAIINENQSQGVIPLSLVTHLPDPLYSELPDLVIECTNNNVLASSTPTLNDINKEFFRVRHSESYNTLPKARQNTDPLPLPPSFRPRSRTPEPRMAYRTNTCADSTNTARFLSEVNKKKCLSLDRFLVMNKPRERSSTDVDLLDDVFCQDFSDCDNYLRTPPYLSHEEDENRQNDEDEKREKRTESFYADLHSDMEKEIFVYESLHNATKESPETRLSTLERIQQQSRYDNGGFNIQDAYEPDPVYHVLEPLLNDDVAPIKSRDNPTLDSCGLISDNGKGCFNSPECHILEGPETNLTHFPKEGHFLDRDIIQASRRLHRSVSDPELNSFTDYRDIVPEDNKGTFLENKNLRPRSNSFHG